MKTYQKIVASTCFLLVPVLLILNFVWWAWFFCFAGCGCIIATDNIEPPTKV